MGNRNESLEILSFINTLDLHLTVRACFNGVLNKEKDAKKL